MKYFVKNLLYKIGRKLMHLNYAGDNAIEHDLRSQIQDQRREIDELKLKLILAEMRAETILRMK